MGVLSIMKATAKRIHQPRCTECGMALSVNSKHWHTGPFGSTTIHVVTSDGLGNPETTSVRPSDG